MKPRQYQIEAAQALKDKGNGSWLICLPTGSGKSFLMTLFERKGRMLILAHREELLFGNAENFSCDVGFEKAELKSHGEEIVCASVQSMINRLDKFNPNDFDIVIFDECHHAVADQYKKVAQYFRPRQLVGLTATPERADGLGLDMLFDEIIYEKDLRFMIENKYLSPVKCYKIDVGYDLSKVATRMGDFNIKELERQVNIEGAHKAIKKIVDEYDGSYIIACVDIEHANSVAHYVGGLAITQETKNRKHIIEKYKQGEVRILTTVNVLSEGSNLPIAKNLIMAAPTQSSVKYIQLAGRVMRLHEQKDFCRIFDLVGNTGKHSLAGPHTLLGLDAEAVPKGSQVDIIGDLLEDIPVLIKKKSDCPESWIRNKTLVDLFAKTNSYNLHSINYFKHPDGAMIVSLPEGKWIGVTAINQVGKNKIITNKKEFEMQDAQLNFDKVLKILKIHAKDSKPLWCITNANRWQRKEVSTSQMNYANALLKKANHDFRIKSNNTKGEASCIISRLSSKSLKPNLKKRVNIKLNFGKK